MMEASSLQSNGRLLAAVDGAEREALPRASAMVSVLDADPDLGANIADSDWAVAARQAVAAVYDLEPGEWRWPAQGVEGGFGALIVRGLLLLRVDLGGRAHAELRGTGDVVSPWEGIDANLENCQLDARIVTPTRIALLDRRFALRTARWPELHVALTARVVARARQLALQAAINSLPRIEQRLELTLWQLAYRFGRVTPRGTSLKLPITHAQLAEIVGAQRPSVSVALARLREHERVESTPGQGWLLLGEPASLGRGESETMAPEK
jgi:CRP/FNR family transcriptional regulator, cyclic AMP receptor protein